MYIIILGKGFIGKCLEKHLVSNNIACRSISRSDIDYTDTATLNRFLDDALNLPVSAVINCSGYTGYPNVDACESNKELCYNYNVHYPLKVLIACKDRHIPLIHVGSGCIYTGYEKVYTENDTPNFGIYSDVSSFYSKCKHSFEKIASQYPCYVFRIRIPFNAEKTHKNYLEKLIKYDTLISESNSITSITDFNKFIINFLEKEKDGILPYGPYNVVNPDPITAKEIVSMLKESGVNNPNWTFIKTKDLITKAKRSNCVLSTGKIKQLGLELPPTKESLFRDIEIFRKQ